MHTQGIQENSAYSYIHKVCRRTVLAHTYTRYTGEQCQLIIHKVYRRTVPAHAYTRYTGEQGQLINTQLGI